MKFPKVLLWGSLTLFFVMVGYGVAKNLFFQSLPESVALQGTDKNGSGLGVLSLPDSGVVQQLEKHLEGMPKVDRVGEFFNLDENKFPIVETITYTSTVPWLKGRPAWIIDYARHYETSSHFIARGLNKKPDYFTQKVYPESKFNVFKKNCNFQFYLLVDRSRSIMGFYYIDLDNNQRVLIKTYNIGIDKNSELLGKYLLGNKIAVYRPGIMDFVRCEKREMITIFGTRWIPFGQALENCTVAPSGVGLHGLPWFFNESLGKWVEDRKKLDEYDGGGLCLRVEDMEEIFSIIVTKPTVVEIVKDFIHDDLPGVEVNMSLR
jgi:hypothetical protein